MLQATLALLSTVAATTLQKALSFKNHTLLVGRQLRLAQSQGASAMALLQTACQLGHLQLCYGGDAANWPRCTTPVSQDRQGTVQAAANPSMEPNVVAQARAHLLQWIASWGHPPGHH